jgi:hypothetical protein
LDRRLIFIANNCLQIFQFKIITDQVMSPVVLSESSPNLREHVDDNAYNRLESSYLKRECLNEVAELVILTFEVLCLAIQALWTVFQGVEEQAFTLLKEIAVWAIKAR